MTNASMVSIGIEDLGVYCGVAQISVRALFGARGLDPERLGNLMMDQRSVQLPWEDPVTNAVNAARPLLDRLDPGARDRIELLIVSTESGLDYSKSIATYVHRHLGLSRRCRLLEVKQACYGMTGALQLASGYLASGLAPGAKALVVGTDVNPMDEHARYAEPTTGHGAVALLVSDRPRVLRLNPGAAGISSFETLDTARPAPDQDLYNTDLSLMSYLDRLAEAYRDYIVRVPGVDLVMSFEFLAFHTPFAGMAKAAHRKLMRDFAPRPPRAVEEDFMARVSPSLGYPRSVGNLCSGSLYLALASLIDATAGSRPSDTRLGLYSYGSGCAAEFFSGVIPAGAGEVLRRSGVARHLAQRRELTFVQYEQLLPMTHDCLVPKPHREVDLSGCDEAVAARRQDGPVLVLCSVQDYERRYEWR